MIYLICSIFCSSLLFVIFKYFEKFKVNNLGGIVINYIVAAIMGVLFSSGNNLSSLPQKSWIPHALIVGCVFVALFNLMAITTQKLGLSVVSIANKMAIIFPVIAGVILYNDSMPILKVGGIFMALLAVYLSTDKEDSKVTDKKLWLLPLILFIGSGLIDTFLKYLEHFILEQDETNIFLTSLFLSAGICGLILAFIKKINPFRKKELIGGTILGIPNYASIYFLIKTLETPGFESSAIFPINNMGVVAFSALLGLVLFKEKLSPKNKLGIGLAIMAIVIIAVH